MEIALLETFVAVAEHGGVTKAAPHLMRAPSNVSTRIKQLEREVQMNLFVRDSRSMKLSADGERFLEYAQRILQLVAEASSLAKGDVIRGALHVGALESTAVVRVPTLLADFHLRFPEVQVSVTATNSSELVEGVLSGRFTAVFTDGKPMNPHLGGFKAFNERLAVVTPQSLKLTQIRADHLSPTIFVFGQRCSYRQRFDDWLGKESIIAGRVIEVSSYHSMMACVAAGGGISMIPVSLLDQMPGRASVNVHELPREFGHAQTWLTWRNDAHSKTLTAFVSHVREHVVAARAA